jgi:hypothetical protein
MTTPGSGPWIGALPTSAEPAAEGAESQGLVVAGVVIFCLVGALSAVVEVLLVPFYVGSDVFPIAVLLAVVGNFALPTLVSALVDSAAATVLPVLAWLITAVALGFVNTGDGDVLVPGYGQGQYVALGVFFGGVLAGVVATVRVSVRAGSARAVTRR